MNYWRECYLDNFDNLEKIIRMLAPGDPDRQERWRSEATHTEVAQAFAEKVMFTLQ